MYKTASTSADLTYCVRESKPKCNGNIKQENMNLGGKKETKKETTTIKNNQPTNQKT